MLKEMEKCKRDVKMSKDTLICQMRSKYQMERKYVTRDVNMLEGRTYVKSDLNMSKET